MNHKKGEPKRISRNVPDQHNHSPTKIQFKQGMAQHPIDTTVSTKSMLPLQH